MVKKKALGEDPFGWIPKGKRGKQEKHNKPISTIEPKISKEKRKAEKSEDIHVDRGYSKQSLPDKQEKQGIPLTRRQTYHLKIDLIEKVKAYAYWKRADISDVVNTVLGDFIQAVEKEEGPIKTIPAGTIKPIESIKVKKEVK